MFLLPFPAGSARTVYFPFDILTDTPIDVATEMVKELEIADWEPFEIANMIDGEVSALLPHRWPSNCSDACHTFSYQDDEYDDGPHHHFRSFSSCAHLFSEFMAAMITNCHLRWVNIHGSHKENPRSAPM